MTAARISGFTSEKGRAAFAVRYARMLHKLWPGDRESLDLPTAFGTTRAYRTGRPGGVPVVLLPGAGGNSLMWHRYLTRLGQAHPVIAIDPVGEPGGSTQDTPITDGRQLVAWLGEVLAGLGIDRAHLVGCSYGGWVALRHAIHAPARVVTVTLLDPAGFGRITVGFLAWVVAGGMAGFLPGAVRRRAARWLRNTTLLDDDLMSLAPAMARFRRRLPVPPAFTDDDLRAVTVPTLAIFGARSQMYDAERVAARVRELVPRARVEVIQGAGHDLPMHHPERLADRIAGFTGTPA